VQSRTSETPVNPACTMVAAMTPLRAPMPAKSNAFSTWSAVLDPAPQAGDLLGGIGDRLPHALFVEPRQRSRCAERAERGSCSFLAPVRAAHEIGTQRHQETATKIIAERDRPDHILSAAAFLLGHGKRPPAPPNCRDAPS